MTEKERNKLFFLLQSKWIDIFKTLAEINQITMELLLKERTENEHCKTDEGH